jgi:hypothetical protein
VYISKYRNHWLSPYTVIDYLFFWKDWSKCSRNRGLSMAIDELEGKFKYIEHPEWVDVWAKRLNPISNAIKWFLDLVHPRINYVKVDYWDTWNMDHTLGSIALPMLKQLQKTKHGAPHTDDEDVPEHLRSTAAPAKENEYDIDDNHFERWEWIMNEMIFAFEHRLDDSWEEKYRSGVMDTVWIPVDENGNEVPKGEHKFYQMSQGPKHTYQCDYDGIRLVEERIKNGFRLFGKYYQGLWD